MSYTINLAISESLSYITDCNITPTITIYLLLPDKETLKEVNMFETSPKLWLHSEIFKALTNVL